MKKSLKHICDHKCGHIHKSRKQFQDSVLQGLSKDLDNAYSKFTHDLLKDIFEELEVPLENLSKARAHKYIKRTGSPGNYKYWYKMPDGSIRAKDDPTHASKDTVNKQENSYKIIVKEDDSGLKSYKTLSGEIVNIDNDGREYIQDKDGGLKDNYLEDKPKKIVVKQNKIMTPKEKEVIEGWMNSDIAKDLRRLQNPSSIEFSDLDEDEGWNYGKEIAEDYLKEFDSAFKKLEPYKGEIRRYMILKPDVLNEFLSKYQKGETIRSESYASFGHDNMPLALDSGNIQIKIKNNSSGRKISGTNSKFENIENEVIVPKDVQYKVNNVNTRKNTNGRVQHVIELEEIQNNTKTKKVVVKTTQSSLPFDSNKTNFAGKMDFGTADNNTKTYLSNAVKNAQQVVNKMGVQLKTPINFAYSQGDKDGLINADYRPNSHSINLYRGQGVEKSLMHEIGHAIDYKLSSDGKPLTEKLVNDQDWKDIQSIIKNSDFLKGEQLRGADRTEHLLNPQEMFARAFEVYSYKNSQDLVKQGKLDSSFVEEFYPDLFRGSNVKDVAKFEGSDSHKNITSKIEQINKDLVTEMTSTKDQNKINQLKKDQSALRTNLVTEKQKFEKQYGNKVAPVSTEKRDQIMDAISTKMDSILKRNK